MALFMLAAAHFELKLKAILFQNYKITLASSPPHNILQSVPEWFKQN